MSQQTLLSRIARFFVERGGSDSRVSELGDHLDQLEANGERLSPLDVGSLALLAVRSTLRSLATTYTTMIFIAVAAWWIALWTGALGNAETVIAEMFALENFEFVGPQVLVAFAIIALPVAAMFVTAARVTIPKAYALVVLFGIACWFLGLATGFVADVEAFMEEIFALEEFTVPLLPLLLLYSALALPLVTTVVVAARTTASGARSIGNWLLRARS